MPHLSDFKAFLFDVDQTLTNTDRVITPETRQALSKIVAAGYLVGFCTGKNWGRILSEKIETLFPATSLHILAGGAEIVSGTGEVKWVKGLSTETVLRIAQLCEQHNLGFFVRQTKQVFAYDTIANYLPAASIQRSGFTTLTPDILTQPATSMGVVNPTEEFKLILAETENITCKENVLAGFKVADITARGITKGSTVKVWCELQGLDPSQVIGFGDSNNDTEFLELVGFSVALGNATPEVKAIADITIGHTNDNGLAQYLETILVSKTL